jgi:DNA-binding transcriptional ArsR family regulator/uncharacterized protein YndB with AHSA1/START domain
MDDVFKALGDPTRRQILDLLRQRDGRTVTEIEEKIDMTRFGVMKHLGVLEDVGLITARREGRFKYLHLNVTPLQRVMDRWIDPMLRPWARRLEDLKQTLEGESAMQAAAKTAPAPVVYQTETYIRTTPERLWQALTDPKDTANYYFSTAVASDWKKGSKIGYSSPDGKEILSGEILEIDPPRKLVTTFIPYFGGPAATPTRVTYVLEPMGDLVRLVLTHEGLTEADANIRTGWVKIFNQLKTWLETGKPLDIPRG